jgi:pimeloyl-ACP methyl ester carboxylesterase
MRTVAQRGELIPRADAVDMFKDMAGCAILPRLLAGAEARGPIRPFVADCRVRLAWAGCDHTLPFERYGQPMVDSVGGAELVMLPGVGHVPMYDDPGLVVRTILEVSTTNQDIWSLEAISDASGRMS